MKTRIPLTCATTALFTLLIAVTSFAQSANGSKIDDDWWSIIREISSEENLKPQQQDVRESNFRVLGVVVGRDDLEAIQRKLGTAYVTGRGDAGTARSQICYAGLDGKTYLTFESGEVQYAFYLFNHGPKWSGSEHCVKSKLITPDVSTISGLHLGQTRFEVQRILGKPTNSRQHGDVYFRQIRKKSSDVDLKKAREQYPNMGEREFHENYDYYYATFYIVAKYSNSRLVYLGVSKSDIN